VGSWVWCVAELLVSFFPFFLGVVGCCWGGWLLCLFFFVFFFWCCVWFLVGGVVVFLFGFFFFCFLLSSILEDFFPPSPPSEQDPASPTVPTHIKGFLPYFPPAAENGPCRGESFLAPTSRFPDISLTVTYDELKAHSTMHTNPTGCRGKPPPSRTINERCEIRILRPEK